MARSKTPKAKPATPRLSAKKPPKPTSKAAQGPDGPTKGSVSKEGAEYGGGDTQHGGNGSSISTVIGRALDKVADVLRPKNGKTNGHRDGRSNGKSDGKRDG
jgi:hypothetical protein